jgi:hypothetical protein
MHHTPDLRQWIPPVRDTVYWAAGRTASGVWWSVSAPFNWAVSKAWQAGKARVIGDPAAPDRELVRLIQEALDDPENLGKILNHPESKNLLPSIRDHVTFENEKAIGWDEEGKKQLQNALTTVQNRIAQCTDQPLEETVARMASKVGERLLLPAPPELNALCSVLRIYDPSDRQAAVKLSTQLDDYPADSAVRDLSVRLYEWGIGRCETPPSKEEVARVAALIEKTRSEEEGIGAKAIRVIEEKVDAKVAELEKKVVELPRKVIENITGGGLSSSTDGSSLTNLLQSALGLLSGAGKPLFNALAGSLLHALDAAKTHTTQPQALAAIDQLAGILKTAQEKGEWSALPREITRILNEYQIYFNGIRLPRLGAASSSPVSPVSSLLGMARHQDALLRGQDSDKLAQRSYPELAAATDKQAKEFIANTERFLALKMILETFCGAHPASNDDYLFAIKEARENPRQARAILKKFLFEQIDRSETLFLRKWVSKLSWHFTFPIIHFVISNFCSRFIHGVRAFLKNQNQHNYADISNLLLKNFGGYLETLTGAYERVVKKQMPDGPLPTMLERELKRKECNGGYLPQQLYDAFTKKAVREFAPRVTWTRTIAAYVAKCQLPETSPLKMINPLLRIAAQSVGFLLSVPTGIAEWGSNRFMHWGINKLLVKTEMVDTLLSNAGSALKDNNGYTHALNTVLFTELDELLTQLAITPPDDKASSPITKDLSSTSKRKELSGVVRNLFQVLDKQKHLTREDLQAYTQKTSVSRYYDETMNGIFVNDTVDSVVQTIAAAHQSIMKKEKLEETLNLFMSLVNGAYATPGRSVSEEEFKAMEDGVNDRLKKILELTINRALDQKFDFSKKKLEHAAQTYVQDLQQDTAHFIQETRAALGALGDLSRLAGSLSGNAQASQEALERIGKLLETAKAFLNRRARAASDTGIQPHLDQETKKKLDEITNALTAQLRPITDQLDRAFDQQRQTDHQERVIIALQRIKSALSSRAQQSTHDENSLKAIDELGSPFIDFERLANGNKSLRSIHITLKDALPLIRALIAQHIEAGRISTTLSKDPALLAWEDALRKNTAINELRTLAERAKQVVQKLSLTDEERTQLNRALSVEGRSGYNKQKETLLERATRQIQDLTRQLRQKAEEVSNKVEGSGWTHRSASRPQEIQDSLCALAAQLPSLETWQQQVKAPSIINVSLFDTTPIVGYARNLSYKYIEEHALQALDFLRNPVNYRYGLHPFLLSYLRAKGP